MSHCTTFPFAYVDEGTAVSAFHRMGLSPRTGAVGELTALSKAIFVRIGYAGSRQLRAIIAQAGEYQLFLVREGEEYRLWIEKHDLSNADAHAIQELEMRFRQAYVRASLDGVLQSLDDAGVRYDIEELPGVIKLRFGVDLQQSLRIRITSDNHIEEEVSGVSGNFCEVLTAELEQLLSLSTTELNTTWKPEHSLIMEDEVLQVLRLQ